MKKYVNIKGLCKSYTNADRCDVLYITGFYYIYLYLFKLCHHPKLNFFLKKYLSHLHFLLLQSDLENGPVAY